MRSSKLLFRQTWRASEFKRPTVLPSQWEHRSLQHALQFSPLKTVESSPTPSSSLCSLASRFQAAAHSIPRKPTFRPRPILSIGLRPFSTSQIYKEASKPTVVEKDTKPPRKHDDDHDPEDEERGFVRSEKASQAAQVNLSARLAKDGKSQGQTAGWGEIWRLIKIARPEARVLGYAFIFLLVSSAISMSIPFSIGRILDIATKSDSGSYIFGLDLTTFYIALAGVLTVGAAANYGRIIILRIVGERIVARLRSQLFRKTFVQNAEFFDANRVGDLISRLSSDTIIVGKSITQNLSDGLRSFVSGAAGFSLMAYVSLKLTGILTLMFPPVAIGAFFYGKAIRNLSRKIQRNLGTLTKIAEERLGNVRTSQAFAGEILEVGRYNKQVKKIFELGKTEAFISATFFSSVSLLHPRLCAKTDVA